MTDRIDGYLSKIAQTRDREALVLCLSTGEWILRRPELDDIGLGMIFRDARTAVLAWVHAQKRATVPGTRDNPRGQSG